MKLNEMERTRERVLAATPETCSSCVERSIVAGRSRRESIAPRLSAQSIVTWSLVGVLLLFCYHTKNSARSNASGDSASSAQESAQTYVGP